VRAVDEDGRAVAGATVQVLARERDEWQPLAELTTDAAGWARTAELPAQSYKVEVSAPGRISGDAWFDVGVDEPAQVEVRLDSAHRLLFHVVDDGGKPLADPDYVVEVDIEGADDMAHHEAPVRAGTAEVVAALAGRATAWLVGPKLSAREAAVHFQVPGEVPTLVWRRPQTITGYVRDDRGAPARAFVVVASCPADDGGDQQFSDWSDPQGAFAIEVIGARRCDLTLERMHSADVCARQEGVAADQTGIEFTVPPPLTVDVVDSAGLPLADATLEFIGDEDHRLGAGATDRSGRARFTPCLSETVLLSARDMRSSLQTDAVRVERGTTSVRLQMPPAASVRGRVVTPEGKLARRFMVRLHATDRPWDRHVAGVGSFFLTRLPLGSYTLQVESPFSGDPTTVLLTIDHSEEIDLGTIALQPPAPEEELAEEEIADEVVAVDADPSGDDQAAPDEAEYIVR
jgi:hypothetical protein